MSEAALAEVVETALSAAVARPARRGDSRIHWLQAAFVVLFSALVVRTAWISDDAFITLRTVDNFVHGYGLRWNAAERVQSYTHPLWMLLTSLLYIFTREGNDTLIAQGCLVAGAGLWWFMTMRQTRYPTLWCVAAALLCSKSYVEFSTSGLENPLSHLLLILFCRQVIDAEELTGRRLLTCWALAALGLLTRPDHALLFGPALVWLLWRRHDRMAWGAMVLGLLPLCLWELFSLIYYGSLVPNTAYAKIVTDAVPPATRWLQALWYFGVSCKLDPILPLLLGAGLLAGALRPAGGRGALMLGSLLFLIYTAYVGGDFMAGRFLTAPLLLAACTLATLPWLIPLGWAYGALAGTFALLFALPHSPLRVPLSDAGDCPNVHGVADERLSYLDNTGLWNGMPDRPCGFLVAFGLKVRGEAARVPVLVSGQSGFVGYFGGPRVRLIDQFGLSDALLARLPLLPLPTFRPGHVRRFFPPGYFDSLTSGGNEIFDPRLHEFYRQVRLVTAGPLFAPERWRAIWSIHWGEQARKIKAHDPFAELARTPIPITLIANPNQGDEMFDWHNVWYGKAGVRIDLLGVWHDAELDLRADGANALRVLLLSGGKVIGEAPCPAVPGQAMADRRLHLPPQVAQNGYDQLMLLPVHAADRYVLGRVQRTGQS